jgi:shikimate dehydrogenase
LLAVLGHPVGHSLSPLLHEAGFRARGRAARYIACEVSPARLPAALAGLAALGFRGCNLTVPHKEAGCRLADARSPEAAATGSANTLRFDEGRVFADTTDGRGLLRALAEEAQWEPQGRRAVVLGAGGAARSVVAALLAAGAAEVAVANRTPERARRLVRDLAVLGPVRTLPAEAAPARAAALARADLVVNATTLGMHGRGQPLDDREIEGLPPTCVVCDIVYVPEETPFLAAARRRGLPTVGGLGMLVWQAALAWAVWFGEEGPASTFLAVARDRLRLSPR